MSWLSQDELIEIGFGALGRDVKISRRASIYDAKKITIGDFSRIDDFSVISGKVNIGRNVHIAVHNNVAGGSEGVTIEDFAGLAYGCNIFSQSDDYSGESMTNPTVPSCYKYEKKAGIRIGRHCIIGARSIVMPGVNMEVGCALGAMSMLTKSTEPWSIYFGVPAKRIKKRKQSLLELERRFLLEDSSFAIKK
jgi:acetyltransferase-like isoleucine patch superfamily enzyme